MFALTSETIAYITLVSIALVYALFDVFNNRNVPSVFAYATVIIGVIFTLSSLNIVMIGESIAIAAIISALGYLLFRGGQLGAADVLEFAAISLVLPYLQMPLMSSAFQFNIPFIISVFIASGIAALLMIPVYYIPRAVMILKKPLLAYINTGNLVKGLTITTAYAAFLIFLLFYANANVLLLGLLGIVAISSLSTILFERPITDSMVRFITPKQLEDQDIIAFNLMTKREISAVRKKVKGFNKLVNQKMINELNKKMPNGKLPVYRSAMPMALPIFIGVVVSLLIGNVLIYLF